MLESAARQNGVYYTPTRVAYALTAWALTGHVARVLDPSCGDGEFVKAAVAQLGGSKGFVHGIDIDAAAISELRSHGFPRASFRVGSFFDDVDGRPIQLYDAIVGNPPYVRHHRQDEALMAAAHGCAAAAGVNLTRQADLWASFVIHATQHVALGGRLALILPIAATHADYAVAVWRFVQKSFGEVEVVVLQDRAFKGIREQVVVLLAARRGGSTSRMTTSIARTLDDLERLLLRRKPNAVDRVDVTPIGVPAWKWDLLDPKARSLWQEIRSLPQVQPLGEHARLRIGTVTGANSFFVREVDDPLLEHPGVKGRPVISTSRTLLAPVLEPGSVPPKRLMAVSPTVEPGGALASAILRGEREGLHLRHHCANRDPWWCVRDLDVPDAFLGYMGARPHSLVENAARALCTNSVHRVDWYDRKAGAAIVASSWSSLFRFSAELFGRHYGGGVLKVEPAAAKQLPVVSCPAFGEELARIDGSARAGVSAAIAEADRALSRFLGFTPQDARCLSEGAALLASARRIPR